MYYINTESYVENTGLSGIQQIYSGTPCHNIS